MTTNRRLIEGIKGHIDMMKAADLPDDLPDDMKMWWVDNFGSKASVSVGVFRRALASAGGDAGRVISKAGAQMEEALTNAGITTSESPTELFVDLVVMPIINCVHDGNVEGAELLLFWNEARNAAKKQVRGYFPCGALAVNLSGTHIYEPPFSHRPLGQSSAPESCLACLLAGARSPQDDGSLPGGRHELTGT